MENVLHVIWLICKCEEYLYEIIGINKKDIRDGILGVNDGKNARICSFVE